MRINLDLQYWAGIRFNTSYCNFAESCVFEKQSLLSCKYPLMKQKRFQKRLHLPKLRSYFAEFLQHYYPIHLSILYLSTCVSFRYDLCVRYET